MLKAVVFDLFETLVTQSGADVPRAGRLGHVLGVDPGAFRVEWKKLRPLVLRGRLTFKEALMAIGPRMGAEISAAAAQQACDDRARANATVFEAADRELVALTRELSERGVRLGTISNCMAEDVGAWAGSAFAPQFGCALFSFAVGRVKPEARIYLDALQQLGVSPEDAMFIGDGGDDELAGAQRAGLSAAQAAWFVSRSVSAAVPTLRNREDVLGLLFGRG
jgi:HAD superfamily hydrolase (TIGR01549 family)